MSIGKHLSTLVTLTRGKTLRLWLWTVTSRGLGKHVRLSEPLRLTRVACGLLRDPERNTGYGLGTMSPDQHSNCSLMQYVTKDFLVFCQWRNLKCQSESYHRVFINPCNFQYHDLASKLFAGSGHFVRIFCNPITIRGDNPVIVRVGAAKSVLNSASFSKQHMSRLEAEIE